MKPKLLYFAIAVLFGNLLTAQVTIFSENMGTPGGTTAIAANIFQNSTPITFTGTADVRNTVNSNYPGASGGGNVFFTSPTITNFTISGINTTGYSNLTLSFGHLKSTTASNNELIVEVSADGVTYSPLTYSRATGGGTANVWLLITAAGSIPSTPNLRIRFRQSSTTPQFRIDDVRLTGINEVHWANLQFPTSATVNAGETTTVYAQVLKTGTTEPPGQGAGITAWIGYSNTNPNPAHASWTWVPATYNTDVGNNDEYSAAIGANFVPGTYYYASRFQATGGGYQYGGTGGFYNAVTSPSAIMTVNDITADYASLWFPGVGAITTPTSFNVFAQIYEPGLTDLAGQPSGVQAWIGRSLVDSDPNSVLDWVWIPATWNVQSGNNDEYVANVATGITTPGLYYYAARFQIGNGSYSYGGIQTDGNPGGIWNGTTSVSGQLTVTTPPEINIRQGATNIASGGSHAMGSLASGTSSTALPFTIENLGSFDLNLTDTPKIDVSGTDAASFIVNETTTLGTIPALSNTTFTVTFSPTSQGAKSALLTIVNSDTDETSYTINLTGTATTNATSNIVVKSGYSYPQDIPYVNYQAADITTAATSIEIGQFTIQDGGGAADADNLGTTLTSITFAVSNPLNVRRIAIYDGTTEVSEVVGAASVNFPGLSLTAADGGTKDFSIRASFNTAVTDNQQILLTVTNTSSAPSGSTFAGVNAGGATTPNTSSNNRIEVTADRLAFVAQPSTQYMYVPIPNVSVSANDVNGSRDLDYILPVSITSTGALIGTPVNSTAVAGLATFANTISHSASATARTLTAAGSGLISIVSNTFNVLAGSSPTDYFRSTNNGNWNVTTTWQSGPTATGPWTGASLIPTAASARITIQDPHSVFSTTSVTADDIIVDGYLEIDSSTFTLNNGAAAVDLQVNAGAILYNYLGDFSQGSGAIIVVDGEYWHDTPSLVLPFANSWGPTSTCIIYGLENTTLETLVNAGQTFQNFIWDNYWQTGYIVINDPDFKVLGTMEFGETGLYNNLMLGNSAGTYNNTIGNLILYDGYFVVAGDNAVVNLTIGNLTVTGLSYFFHSTGTGTGNVLVSNNVLVNQDATLSLITSDVSPNQVLTVNGNFTVDGPGGYVVGVELEWGNSPGTGIINVKGNFTSTGNHTAYRSIDFGQGTNAIGNAVYVGGHFLQSGNNTFGSTTTGSAALGFVFNGLGTTQNFTYSGGNVSNRTSYMVAPGAVLNLLSGILLGQDNSPQSSFTVQNTGTLNFNTQVIRPNNTASPNPRFVAESGATLITSNSGGFGGTTTTTGSLRYFASLNETTGKVSLPDGVNYVFNAGTTTPFPIPTANFGDPANVTINTGTVVSNMATQLQITNSLAVNNASIFRLNTVGTNNLRLQNATMTIAPSATFDNSGENTIINGGTTSSISVSGRFITRHTGGFIDTGSAIPSAPVTLNPGSTVEYGLLGNQVVQGIPPNAINNYYNVAFSGSGTKLLAGPDHVQTSITITGPVIFDALNHNFGTASTNLTMIGPSTYKTAGGGVAPDAGGAYSLAVGSTIEFTSTAGTTNPRATSNSYANVVVSGTNVVNTNINGLQFRPGGANFTVKNGGIFKLENVLGFSGAATGRAISNTNNPTITLEPGSSIEYSNAGDQTISPFLPSYSNLIISGSGVKTLPTASEIVVGEDLTVTSATLQIDADRTMTVTDAMLNTGGVIDIKNDGSLVQITDVDNATLNNNVGDIKMERQSTDMTRYDFTYWGSPVHNDSSFTLHALSPDTLWDKYFEWDPDNQEWDMIPNGAQTMIPGRGYIVRGSQLIPLTAGNVPLTASFSTTFLGKANNGIITVPIMSPTIADPADKLNLLGNPYPSAIDAVDFVTLNTNLGGTLYFWTHNSGTTLNGTIYTYDPDDYATWNIIGSAAPNSGVNNNPPSGKIAAGQGFFVHGWTNTPTVATFNNSMRVRTPGENSDFFRPASSQQTATADTIEKYRIWLNLTNPGGAFNQNLTGYVTGATLGVDRLFDAKNFSGRVVALYSLVDDTKLTIQGRPLPFDIDDKVDMGYKTTIAGQLTIAIDHFDPFFDSQNIYIEDKLLNIIHDLKQSPYTFISEIGTFNDRFRMRYTTTALNVTDFENAANFVVTVKDRKIDIYSVGSDIKSVSIFDLLGRNVYESGAISTETFTIDNVIQAQQALIVKTKLADGQIISKKIIY